MPKEAALGGGSDLLAMTERIVSAYLSRNPAKLSALPELIHAVHDALCSLDSGRDSRLRPAVPIEQSIGSDHIVCLEDGRKVKLLRRHLSSTHGMTPEEYRQRWGLPHDYLMVAPDYSKTRRRLAREHRLGKPATPSPARRSRRGRKA